MALHSIIWCYPCVHVWRPTVPNIKRFPPANTTDPFSKQIYSEAYIYIYTHTHKQQNSCLVIFDILEKGNAISNITYLSMDTGHGDSSVVRAPDSWSKGRGFESLLERRDNFLLQGRLSVLTLISVSVPPPCYHSSTLSSLPTLTQESFWW